MEQKSIDDNIISYSRKSSHYNCGEVMACNILRFNNKNTHVRKYYFPYQQDNINYKLFSNEIFGRIFPQ